MFDLDKAVAAWRRTLEYNRTFTADDVDELEQHIRDQVAALTARGGTEEAAFERALREMGGQVTAESEYRKVYWGKITRRRQLGPELLFRASMLRSFFQIAIRTMRKQKLHSFINLSGLTVGIASCLLIALFVLHERGYDRFHEKAERVYRLLYDDRLGENLPSATGDELLVWGSAAHAPPLEADFPEIEHAVRLSGRHQILLGRDDVYVQEECYFFADSAFFEVFSFPMLRGDPSTALVRPYTIVLSESTARRHFGSEDPLGKTLRIDSGEADGDVEVTGVIADVPANSHLDFDILISMSTFEQNARADGADFRFDSRGYIDFFTYVLLREGTAAEVLQAKLPEFVKRHYGEGLQDPPRTYSLVLEPLTEAYHSPAGRRQPLQAGPNGNPTHLYLFSFVGLFIVAIACFNFMNLATARSLGRAKEVGIRKTVGAGRGGLVSQFLTEALMLSVLATTLAAVVAWLALPLFRDLAGKEISAAVVASPSMLMVLLCGAIVIGLLAGGYPALLLSRFRPAQVLKGSFGTSGSGAALRKGLVAFQFAIAIALIGATLTVRAQLDYLQERPLGFDDEQQLVLDFGGDGDVRENLDAVKQELAALPGVRSVAAARSVPGGYFPGAGTRVEAPDGEMRSIELGLFEVDTDFLSQLGVGTVAGRLFRHDVATDADGSLILNEAAARALGYVDPAEAVGKQFNQWGREGEVVGVVEDFNHESLHNEIRPLSFRVSPWLRYIVVQTATEDASAVVAAIRERWSVLVPHRPFLYSFLDQSFDALYRSEDRFGALFGTFAGLAIFIACLGLFGLAAYAVQRRTKEIGVRKVLGATVPNVAALLSKEFLKLVVIGFVIAAPAVYFLMNEWLAGFAYRIVMGPGIFLAAGGLALLVAVVTVSYQAVKAALTDPVKALRYE